MIEIVTNNNFDFDNYEYAICECTSWDEGIQVPRKEDNYFASFDCPRCGRELGLFVHQRNIKNDSIYSDVSIRGRVIMEELIRKIELILIETGQHDLKFKLGEIIKYSPKEVGEILRKHKDELRQTAN